MNSKNRSTPVVEKKEVKTACACGDNCQCGCTCNCSSVGKTLLLCGTILVSAALVAAAITLKPCKCADHMKMRRPMPEMAIPAPKVNFEEKIAAYIAENPKALIDSVEKFYQKEQAKAAPAKKREFSFDSLAKADAEIVNKIVNDKTNYSLGNKDGKFVIIEFFDYNCGWCKRTNKAMAEAVASAEGKNIRWIPIDTPIFGESSETIARYVLAAGEQGKYAEMHEAVGNATGKLDEAALIELGKTLKLDTKKLTADANGEKIKGKLAANNEFRQKLNINGVPMLIVDGRINPGALIGENLEAVVKLSAQKK
jgi:protein-disulfide isomerase